MSGFSSVTGGNGIKPYRILSKNTWDLLNKHMLCWRVSSGFKLLQYINSIRLCFHLLYILVFAHLEMQAFRSTFKST